MILEIGERWHEDSSSLPRRGQTPRRTDDHISRRHAEEKNAEARPDPVEGVLLGAMQSCFLPEAGVAGARRKASGAIGTRTDGYLAKSRIRFIWHVSCT